MLLVPGCSQRYQAWGYVSWPASWLILLRTVPIQCSKAPLHVLSGLLPVDFTNRCYHPGWLRKPNFVIRTKGNANQSQMIQYIIMEKLLLGETVKLHICLIVFSFSFCLSLSIFQFFFPSPFSLFSFFSTNILRNNRPRLHTWKSSAHYYRVWFLGVVYSMIRVILTTTSKTEICTCSIFLSFSHLVLLYL